MSGALTFGPKSAPLEPEINFITEELLKWLKFVRIV
jgi:hypothetical protein